MIRAGTSADIPRLVELGAMLHGSSVFRAIKYDPAKVAATLDGLVRGAGVLFVAEREGMVIGGLAGGITEYWFSREKVGFDYSFFIEPSERNGFTAMKLIRAMEIWCKGQGARELQMGITTGINVDNTSKFYELVGFQNAGPIFKKEL